MAETFGVLFSFGLVTWLGIFALFALSVFLSEAERVDVATLTALVVCVALWWFRDVNVAWLIWEHPIKTIAGVAGWFVIGTVWSFYKWDLFALRERRRYDDAVQNAKGSASQPKWESFRPLAMQRKRKISTWIILWPQSMFWYVFSDLIHDIVDIIIRNLSHIYDRITNRHFKDLPPTPKKGN